MEREELIKKWLDNNLNEQEQKAFEELEDYETLINLDNTMKGFKAPSYNATKEYEVLKPKLKPKSKIKWLQPLLKIAAILVVGISVFFFTQTFDTTEHTLVAETRNIELPDLSTVNLNSSSSLVFNKMNWNNKREVELKGEAFFKVAKGKTFDVKTKNGIVSVLGTQFNVKQRNGFFEVVCYEGLVAVKTNKTTTKLKPGERLTQIDGELIALKEKENKKEPSWLHGESSFKSVPIHYVISELETVYDVTVNTDVIDGSRLYSGSFTHNNLDIALKSITLPLELKYSKPSKNSIVFSE